MDKSKDLIYQAIGEASMCWSNIRNAGYFKSNDACRIAEQLYDNLFGRKTKIDPETSPTNSSRY